MSLLLNRVLRAGFIAGLLLLSSHTLASFSEPEPSPQTSSSDFEAGKKAIEAKQWREAIQALEKVVAKDSKNADAENWLGYASRKLGKMDAAFAHYDKALAINPKHRGAHEYVGEAYLMVDKPAEAEKHLLALKQICGESCEEYKDLQEALADYKGKH